MGQKARRQATADWAAECKLKKTNWWGAPLPAGAAAIVSGLDAGRDLLPAAPGLAAASNVSGQSLTKGANISLINNASVARQSKHMKGIPTALLATAKPLSGAEIKARRRLVLRATTSSNDSGFESQWASSPDQPLMPLVAELELSGSGHRPHSMAKALLGIAPDGPLCNWAEAEDAFTACIARRVHKAEIDSQPQASEALKREKERLEKVPVWDLHNPVSWGKVSADARRSGEKAFIGDIMSLVLSLIHI